MSSWLRSMCDPELVWQFQHRWGVDKVRVVHARDDDDDGDDDDTSCADAGGPRAPPAYVAVHEDDYHPAKVRVSAAGHSSTEAETDSVAASSSSAADAASARQRNHVIVYRITNWFYHYFFLLGTQLGDETYYALFFCCWFWNIDSAVGRRVLLVWNLIMYIGQGMKDIIRWPRPSMPPAVQLEKKWALEYGMPSTHAMAGLALPMSIIFFTWGRYQYPFFLWFSIACIWTAMVCTSRIYLGMHSYADIYVGLAFSALLCLWVFPLCEYSDSFLISNKWSPLITIPLSILAIVYYPGSDRWTPARGDTTEVCGSYLGSHLGSWITFQLGYLRGPSLPPPHPILWPSYSDFGQVLMRTVVGGVALIGTRAIFKPLTYGLLCSCVGEDMTRLRKAKNDIRHWNKLFVEMGSKFLTYVAVGIATVFLAPLAFKVIGIERSLAFTEV